MFFQDTLNFSYSITKPPDNDWGIDYGHGNWSGIVGMLSRQEADIGMHKFERLSSLKTFKIFRLKSLKV